MATASSLARDLKILRQEMDGPHVEAVMNQLVLEYMDDLPTLQAFLEAFAESGGDLSLLFGRTHEPVTIEEFIFSDEFLGLRRDQVWPGVLHACKDIIEKGYVEALLMGAIGIGKALDLHTPIPTPTGWTTMGALKDGDIIYDETGSPCRVVRAHEVLHGRNCFRVEFSDDTWLIADEEHLWYTETRNDRRLKHIKATGRPRRGTVKTTAEIASTLIADKRYQNHSIPLTGPLAGTERRLRIDPYVLGVWLGDGATADNRVSCQPSDYEVIEHVHACGYNSKKADNGHIDRVDTYTIGPTPDGELFVHALDVFGLRQGKFIPRDYLRASYEQRLALMQGLLDTDGHIMKTGVVEYCTASERLAAGMMELARSLGLKPTLKRKESVNAFVITFTAYADQPVFRLSRKRALQPVAGAQQVRQKSRYITAVVPVESRPVRCITVDSPNRLYLAGEGMIPTHNTTVAQIVTAYHLYLLSVEKFPQLRFGLFPTSTIVVAMLNITDALAERVTFGQFRQMLEPVPYFKEHFPFPLDLKSEMRFPNNIIVIPAAASAQKLLGMNVIGGIVDEMNFMAKIEKSKQARDGGEFDQAKEIYTSIVRRRKSRFQKQGKLPGCLAVVSSKGGPGDFTEIRKAEVEEEDDGLTYIWGMAQWEARPRTDFKPETFTVEIGDERHDSRILPEGEEPREGAKLIHPPIDFLREFQRDMEGSLRDLAGISTLSKKPFFGNRESIWRMADLYQEAGYVNVFRDEIWDLSNGLPPINDKWTLRNPERTRAAHIDLGLTSDHAGISIGHAHGITFEQRRNVNDPTKFDVEELPVIAYDGVIAIKPPVGGEIDFEEVRNILYMLRFDLGIPIKWVTMDGFQSVDTRQILRKKGFKTEYVSVDGKESIPIYRAFRSAVRSERVLAPEHKRGFVELASLELIHDKATPYIDHPANGSKDVADSMAGVFKTIMERRSSWRNLQPVAPKPSDAQATARNNEHMVDDLGKRPKPKLPRPRTSSRPRSRLGR